jgi:methylenetetrahydrofolate dehydrogenase (NADP+)/methenyltetrahydrofolate cyclohydrolase
VRADCARQVKELQQAHGVTPHLAVILVGDNPASLSYVRSKLRAASDVGITTELLKREAEVKQTEIVADLNRLNRDPSVHGILIQLPLPSHLNLLEIIKRISPHKDVDGFHLYNAGGLVAGDTVFPPCTPFGVTKLLEYEAIPIAGQNVVVIGASNIVGKPMALMMTAREATVAICHARTRDLAQFTILADILVVAAGVPRLIVPPMVKTGAVVIDVGINRLPTGEIVGDVDFEGVYRKASHLTPVPGGVGPMTVTMLLANTVNAAVRLSGASRRVAPTQEQVFADETDLLVAPRE